MKWPLEIDGWLIHDWTFDHAFQPGELFIFEEDLEAFRSQREYKIHVVTYANPAHITFWNHAYMPYNYETGLYGNRIGGYASTRVERVHQVTRAPAK